MVKYSAILSLQKVIEHLSQYIDDVENTDLAENLTKLPINVLAVLKLKYEDKAGLRISCNIRKADAKKFAITENIVGGM